MCGVAIGSKATVMLFIVVVLSACHSGHATSRQGAHGGLDACSLVTAAEVGNAIGSRVTSVHRPPAIRPEPGLAFCEYDNESRFGAVVVDVQRPGRQAYEQRKQRAIENTAIRPPMKQLSGLGEDAFSVGGGANVLQRDIVVGVTNQMGRGDFTPIAEKLSEIALHRLP
jgi:hypothetical protein